MSAIAEDWVAEQLIAVLDEAMLGANGESTYFVDNEADRGLLGALRALTSGQASTPVLGRSIAAHVHHVVFAMEASAAWINGDHEPRDWSASWLVDAVDDEHWAEMLRCLGVAHSRLRDAILGGRLGGDDALAEAVGSIAHIAYHLGSVWQKITALDEA